LFIKQHINANCVVVKIHDVIQWNPLAEGITAHLMGQVPPCRTILMRWFFARETSQIGFAMIRLAHGLAAMNTDKRLSKLCIDVLDSYQHLQNN
jgi:phosphosulfolactate synthase (CoM biosynthesis protein A)